MDVQTRQNCIIVFLGLLQKDYCAYLCLRMGQIWPRKMTTVLPTAFWNKLSMKMFFILIAFLLKFISKGPINKKSFMVQTHGVKKAYPKYVYMYIFILVLAILKHIFYVQQFTSELEYLCSVWMLPCDTFTALLVFHKYLILKSGLFFLSATGQDHKQKKIS